MSSSQPSIAAVRLVGVSVAINLCVVVAVFAMHELVEDVLVDGCHFHSPYALVWFSKLHGFIIRYALKKSIVNFEFSKLFCLFCKIMLTFQNTCGILVLKQKEVIVLKNEFERVSTTPDRLREAMSVKGIKQVDLVRSTGIDKGSISSYLSGRYEPKQEAIYKMALALDVSEMWLWGYDVPMERPKAQKNNDAISDIVLLLRSDEEFLSIVLKISKMDSEKRKNLNALLN